MPIRERIKKTFTRRGSSTSIPKEYDPTDRSCSLYYQPGEKIPYKYRRPVEPAHKAHLESFTFGNAWRRKSHQSEYSPMGSRLPSRNNSIARGHNPFDGVRVSMGTLDGSGTERSRSGSSTSTTSHHHKPSGHAPTHHHSGFDGATLEPIQSVMSISPDDKGTPASESTDKKHSDYMFTANELNEALKRAEIVA